MSEICCLCEKEGINGYYLPVTDGEKIIEKFVCIDCVTVLSQKLVRTIVTRIFG